MNFKIKFHDFMYRSQKHVCRCEKSQLQLIFIFSCILIQFMIILYRKCIYTQITNIAISVIFRDNNNIIVLLIKCIGEFPIFIGEFGIKIFYITHIYRCFNYSYESRIMVLIDLKVSHYSISVS